VLSDDNSEVIMAVSNGRFTPLLTSVTTPVTQSSSAPAIGPSPQRDPSALGVTLSEIPLLTSSAGKAAGVDANAPCGPERLRRAQTSIVRQARYVRDLRQAGAELMRHWGLPQLADDVALVIGEMGSNAVEHGHGTSVDLAVTYDMRQVHIEVDDRTPGSRPRLLPPDPHRENGRGMFIVAALATHWGTSDDGTCTWCTLEVPSGR
jgi:anti-sigma regulatory factor (Ser/Thr protein kinase)